MSIFDLFGFNFLLLKKFLIEIKLLFSSSLKSLLELIT